MKKSMVVIVASALTLGLLLSGASFAEKKGKPGSGSSMEEKDRSGPPFHHPDRGPGPEGPGPEGFRGIGGSGMHAGLFNHPEVQKKLKLTPEQVEALKKNRSEQEKRRIKLEADLEIARIELEDLLRADEIDRAAIDTQVDTLGELHKQQVRGMVDHILAIHDIFDATQIEQVRNFMNRMRERRGSFEAPWAGERGDRGRMFREERKGREDEPGEDREPRRGPRWDNDNRRHEGPPPPREGRAPSMNPDGDSFGFAPPPGSFGPQPGFFPPSAPGAYEMPVDRPAPGEDFADLGAALDEFLTPQE